MADDPNPHLGWVASRGGRAGWHLRGDGGHHAILGIDRATKDSARWPLTTWPYPTLPRSSPAPTSLSTPLR